MPGIFLSYRRTDADFALEIYNSLRGRWGERRVFWDVESIEGGTPWASSLREAVRQADAVLVLIGPQWLTVTNKDGVRRLDAPNDWVRAEIAEAFAAGRPVIPVLAPDVSAPRAGDLPESLARLASLQALRMEHRRFATRLIEAVEPYLGPLPEGGALSLDPLRAERITRLLTDQTRRLQNRALELVGDGRYDRSLEELNAGTSVLMALLDFAPNDVWLGLQQGFLYKTVGQAHERKGAHAEAQRYFVLAQVVFERIRNLGAESGLSDPERASAINGLGATYQHFHDPVAAMRAYREAATIHPGYAYAWHDLAAVLLHLAEREGLVDMVGIRQAVEQLEATRKLPGDLPKGALGDKDVQRLVDWEQDLAKRINDPTQRPKPEDWMNYAYRLIQQNRGDLAMAAVEEAIDGNPPFPEPRLYRAILLVGDGQLDTGLAELEQLVKQWPRLEMAYYTGACAYALKGNAESALDWLEQALRLEPRRKPHARNDEHLAPLRTNPRFQALVSE